MNVDENHTGIDVYDAVKLYKYIMGDPSITSLGVAYYTYTNDNVNDLDNVSNLLIIDGHYDKDVNIPFSDFASDPWVIHEKFFNYLFGMAIHPYSNSEDITYLQKLIVQCFIGSNKYTESLFYPGYYSDKLKEAVMEFQTSQVTYTLGDLNRDGVLDNADLTMLRNYLDDENVIDYNMVYDYLAGTLELTEEQIAALDVTYDGKLTNDDLEVYWERITDTYSDIFRTRADINEDGRITEDDYTLLYNEVNGITSDLKIYETTFNLGYCDVEIESILELDYNSDGDVSEVSK